ncbi:hypothetical protein LIER_36611 [Lithospermum erythrorhizon]|uniref:Integrase catalytic domain-containing protein n=1 Tax=Lithospermum erythrorhizon TaxID=34254 RepID=A0AAV3PD17_LITER
MVVDYFTKWVEAKPLPRKDQEQVYRFLKDIFTKFGVPRVLVRYNGTQFTTGKIEDLCTKLDIDHKTASMSYPQAHSQVDVMNKELPTVLWSFRTTPNPIIGETPFSLVYEFDALLPVEIHTDMARLAYYDEIANEQGLQLNLDLSDVHKMVKYKKKVVSYYNKKVWSKQFLVGDLFPGATQASAHGKPGKLESP